MIPPPLHISIFRECAGTFRLPARVFLLVLVLAAGVSHFPPEASAQLTGSATWSGSVVSYDVTTSSPLTAYAFVQTVTAEAPSGFRDWSARQIVACNWTSVQPSAAVFTATPTGCRVLRDMPMVTAATLDSNITPTATEISNGGVVVLIAQVRPTNKVFLYSEWVPLVAPGITVSPAGALSITEAGSGGTYNVKLAAKPSGGVKVRVASNNTDVTVNKSGGTAGSSQDLSFTASNWNTNQAITVKAVNDSDQADESATLTYSIVTANTVSDYDGVGSVTRTVNVTDNDRAGILTGTVSGQATEAGGLATFTVKLGPKQPTADVTIAVSSGDTTEGTVSPSSLTFTTMNWNATQTVTVTGKDDVVVDGNPSYAITLNPSSADNDYNGLSDVTVSMTTTDDDTAGITTGAVSGQATEAGGTAMFTVKLDTQPAADVTIAVSSGDTTEGTVSPSSLTFTMGNWNTTQEVTVTGKDDDVDDGNPSYAITLNPAAPGDTLYNGLGDVTVSMTTTDDDTAGITTGEVSGQATEAGGTATFTVKLDSEPTADVTIAVSSTDTTEGTVSPSSLTFTSGDWDTTQEVTVTGKDDDVADGGPSYAITLNPASLTDTVYDGLGDVTVSVTTTDDDMAGASVTPERSLRSTTEDNAGTVELGVALSSKPVAAVTVTVTSSDTTEGVVKAAGEDDPTLTFELDDTNGKIWSTAQTVTVTGVDDGDVDGDVEYNIRLAFASTGGDSNYQNLVADIPFTNLDDDLYILSISGGGEVTEGDSGSSARAVFTVSLAPAGSQEVSVSYATADGTAEAGSDYAAASGTVTFSPGEISRTVTVTVNGDDEAEANETFSVTLTGTPHGRIDSRNSSAEAVIVNDDEKMVDASMSGEFSVGDTTVTVDSTLPADTGLEVVLPSELESGGAVIEELTVTLGPTDAEIDAERFGYTGTDADHVLVDIDVSPVPDGAVRICLPVTEGLRRAAGGQRLYLIRFSGGSWEELSSTTEGDKVCADVNGFSPFALVYRTDYVKRRFGEVNRAILPELSRAMTASALEAITGRIDDAMAGGPAVNSLSASAPREEEYGHVEPGLRFGELEDGETLSLLDSIDGSYFSVSLAEGYGSAVGRGEEDSAPGAGDVSVPRSGGLGVWISGDYRNLSGKSGGLVDWDGKLVSGHLGADYRFGQSFLAGVATSWSQGSFDYTGRGKSGRVSGDYGSRMNSFHPYLGLSLSRRLDVWAAGGWGFGEIRIDDGEVSGRRKAATRLGTLATGANLRLLGDGATALSLKGEAWISRMKVKDNGGRIEGLRVGTNRLRATLEGSHALAFGSGSSLVPSLEFGIRRDGGDGETGVGGELGGGIAYASSFGLAVEARGRALVFHQGDTGEWGVGGSVRFDPGEDGRGLSISVLPTYGNSSSGVQGLWENEASDSGSSGSERELGLETEIGYGFAAPGARGLLTPYGAFGRSGGDGRSYGVGSRFSMGGTFDIALEGRRRELRAGEAEHGLTLRGRFNW